MALEAAVVATKRRRVALFLRMLERCLCGPQEPRTCCSTAQPLPTRLLPLGAAAVADSGPGVLTCAGNLRPTAHLAGETDMSAVSLRAIPFFEPADRFVISDELVGRLYRSSEQAILEIAA